MEYNKLHNIAIQFGKTLIKKDPDLKKWVEDMFPELKESEDERIRKELWEYFHNLQLSSDTDFSPSFSIDDILAWLKKQGENTHNKELSELLHKVICRFINDPNIPYTEREKVSMEIIPYVERLEKQGEQKSAEWKQDNIKELTEFEAAMLHIGESFFGKNHGLNSNDTSVVKEQAMLLLEFVANKPAWSEEDEENNKNILYILNQLKGTAIYKEDKTAENCIDWLKSLKDRYIWKPSDEQIREGLDKAASEWDSKAWFSPIAMVMDGDRPIGTEQHTTSHADSFKAGVEWVINKIKAL